MRVFNVVQMNGTFSSKLRQPIVFCGELWHVCAKACNLGAPEEQASGLPGLATKHIFRTLFALAASPTYATHFGKPATVRSWFAM